MNFGELIYDLLPQQKQLIRNIEKHNRKLCGIKYSLVFNKNCINENILPTYANIYI